MVEGAGALVRKRAADNSDDDDYWGKMARCEDEACEEEDEHGSIKTTTRTSVNGRDQAR